MRYSSSNRGIPSGSPIANVFVIVVGALAIGVSIVLGFLAFVVLGSIVAVLAVVIGLRIWWLNRRLRRQGRQVPGAEPPADKKVIEGEYDVLDEGRDNKPSG